MLLAQQPLEVEREEAFVSAAAVVQMVIVPACSFGSDLATVLLRFQERQEEAQVASVQLFLVMNLICFAEDVAVL